MVYNIYRDILNKDFGMAFDVKDKDFISDLQEELEIQEAHLELYKNENMKLKKKIAYVDKILKMYEKVLAHTNDELKESNQIIKAHELIEKMNREELLHAYAVVQAMENVSNLSREELLKKDKELANLRDRYNNL